MLGVGWIVIICHVNQACNRIEYLTIIPRARMGSESMAHEPNAEWAIDVDSGHEDERDNFFSKIQLVGQKLACSKRSDSGERCEVKKAMKSRGGLYFLYYLPRFYFFALLFTSHRSPLSERMEQATTKCAVLLFFPRLSVDMWSYKARAIHLNNSNR